MTILGADCTSSTVAALNSLGAKFVSRYLSPTPGGSWKNLTPAEAQTLKNAGIDIVSNWEWGTGDYLGGHAQGVSYAQQAETQHLACGGPAGAPIYFSVDADVSENAADDYFRGIVSVLGVSRVGVYGSTGLLRHLKSVGLVTYTWRTMSTDWSGGAGNQGEFNITQTGYFNSNYDRDVAWTDDFGQWSAHGGAVNTTPPPTPTPVSPPSSGATNQTRATHNVYTPLAEDGYFGSRSWEALQYVLGVSPDGNPGPKTYAALQKMLTRFTNPATGRVENLVDDGVLGTKSIQAFQEKVGVGKDGQWGPGTSLAAQKRLNQGILYGSN